MSEKSASSEWAWPVECENYDRNPELNAGEKETLNANRSCLAQGNPPSIVVEKCGFPRLMKPIEDVATHIELHQKYWPHLKALMLRDMAVRGRSFWGWTEAEWIESINNGGHEKPSVAAVAYVLCGFDSLHKLGRYNHLFYGAGDPRLRTCARPSSVRRSRGNA